VLKLLEKLEVQMIADVKRKIQKEVSLALAERARDENSTLPTDLWRRAVGRLITEFTLSSSIYGSMDPHKSVHQPQMDSKSFK